MSNLQGNYTEAQTLYEESLALGRESGEKSGVAASLSCVANAWLKLGDNETAQTLHFESLSLYHELDDQRGVVKVIANLARIRQVQRHLQLAVSLLASVETLLMKINMRLSPPEDSDQQQTIILLCTQLEESSFATAWKTGQSFTLTHDQASHVLARRPPLRAYEQYLRDRFARSITGGDHGIGCYCELPVKDCLLIIHAGTLSITALWELIKKCRSSLVSREYFLLRVPGEPN